MILLQSWTQLQSYSTRGRSCAKSRNNLICITGSKDRAFDWKQNYLWMSVFAPPQFRGWCIFQVFESISVILEQMLKDIYSCWCTDDCKVFLTMLQELTYFVELKEIQKIISEATAILFIFVLFRIWPDSILTLLLIGRLGWCLVGRIIRSTVVWRKCSCDIDSNYWSQIKFGVKINAISVHFKWIFLALTSSIHDNS